MNALFFEPLRAFQITLSRLGEIVLAAVDLDGETNCWTIEVQHIGADRVLPTEAQASDLIPA